MADAQDFDMPGWITFNRDPIDKIGEQVKTKIPHAVRAVLRELVWQANYEAGFFGGIPMKRGDVCISEEAIEKYTFLTRQTCRSALATLLGAKIITQYPFTNQPSSNHQVTNQVTNRSKIYHIEIYDDIVIPETNQPTNQPSSNHQVTASNRSKEVKKEERTLTPMSASADVPVLPGLETVSQNGKARTQEIESVFAHYRSKIHDEARLLEKARTKIRVRLKTYSPDDLCRSINLFAADAWWMENNGRRGLAWFFNSDERIEGFLNLVPRETSVASPPKASCPEHGMPAMRREGWDGKLVMKCQKCNFAYKTEALWTERPQDWEKTLSK